MRHCTYDLTNEKNDWADDNLLAQMGDLALFGMVMPMYGAAFISIPRKRRVPLKDIGTGQAIGGFCLVKQRAGY